MTFSADSSLFGASAGVVWGLGGGCGRRERYVSAAFGHRLSGTTLTLLGNGRCHVARENNTEIRAGFFSAQSVLFYPSDEFTDRESERVSVAGRHCPRVASEGCTICTSYRRNPLFRRTRRDCPVIR